MKRFRKQFLFLADAVLLALVTGFYMVLALRYGPAGNRMLSADAMPQNVALLFACVTVFQLAFHTYDSLWRYAESREYLMLLAAALCGFFTYEVLVRILFRPSLSFFLLTGVAALWVLSMLLIRFAYRGYRTRAVYKKGREQVPVAIVGAGSAGVQLLDELRNNPDSPYLVRCFFDDAPEKIGRNIHGVSVVSGMKDMDTRLEAMKIQEVIVAIPSLSEGRRQEILKALSAMGRVKVSLLPSTLDYISHKPLRSQMREIRIEDLLGREPVKLDQRPVDVFLWNKTVLVTGGGGSIGSELCRQIAKHHPRQLVVLDIYENNAYDIQQELRGLYGGKLDLRVEIASIRDSRRLHQIFFRYKPDVVFHAAAHKHVPLMEDSPQEAVRNNVFGTLNLVREAELFGVSKFIQISTDKAVNPTSVMGATKRMCEMILQSRKGKGKTVFSAVRFGNVLGSNGSVVPLFQRQIAAGGPVTITDKRIIRYFMTIPEAAELVLQAGAMAEQNELFVLNMGRPVKILDLAENLIRLSGHIPYRDIDIQEVGLRPGEKLYEELLIASRDIEKTENEEIFVERQPVVTQEELERKLAVLERALEECEPGGIRRALHAVVPTFHEPEEVNAAQGGTVEIPEQRQKAAVE